MYPVALDIKDTALRLRDRVCIRKYIFYMVSWFLKYVEFDGELFENNKRKIVGFLPFCVCVCFFFFFWCVKSCFCNCCSHLFILFENLVALKRTGIALKTRAVVFSPGKGVFCSSDLLMWRKTGMMDKTTGSCGKSALTGYLWLMSWMKRRSKSPTVHNII